MDMEFGSVSRTLKQDVSTNPPWEASMFRNPTDHIDAAWLDPPWWPPLFPAPPWQSLRFIPFYYDYYF